MTALCLPMLAGAENDLKLVTSGGEAGSQVTLSIDLENDVDIIVFGATLVLPDGVSIVMFGEDNDIAFQQTGRAENKDAPGGIQSDYTQCAVSGRDVTLRYLPFPLKLARGTIVSGRGTVLTAQLQIDKNLEPGKYDILLKDIYMQTWGHI